MLYAIAMGQIIIMNYSPCEQHFHSLLATDFSISISACLPKRPSNADGNISMKKIDFVICLFLISIYLNVLLFYDTTDNVV